MKRLDPAEVRRIARLARLDLSDAEVERLRAELAQVLGHFAELGESGMIGGLQERGLAPRVRSDIHAPDELLQAPERLAPEWRDGLFLVPRLPALGPGQAEPTGGGSA